MDLVASWVRIKGSNCPSYPIHITEADLPRILKDLEEGDSVLISRPLREGEGQESARASP